MTSEAHLRQQLRDTEVRLSVAEQKFKHVSAERDALLARKARLERELGLDQQPLTGWDCT